MYRNQLVDEDDEDGIFDHDDLIDLYILADRWQMVVLKNVVVDMTIEGLDWIRGDDFPVGLVQKVYKHTGPKDPLRELWVDFFLWESDHVDKDQLQSDTLHGDFLKDFLMAQLHFIRTGQHFDTEIAPFHQDASRYHRKDEKTGACCCRSEFGEVGHEHRLEYLAARNATSQPIFTFYKERAQRLETRNEMMESLNQSKKAKAKAEAELKEKIAPFKHVETQLSAKAKALEDAAKATKYPPDEEARLKRQVTEWKSKAHNLEQQLADMVASRSKLNSAKDKEINALKARTKTLEDDAKAATQQYDAYVHNAESAKRRKMDQDWRHSGSYY